MHTRHVAVCCPAAHRPGTRLSRAARTRQVKARMRECQLHRDSPLGDALLECYACGSRNAFALGFVPVRAGPCMLECEDARSRMAAAGPCCGTCVRRLRPCACLNV